MNRFMDFYLVAIVLQLSSCHILSRAAPRCPRNEEWNLCPRYCTFDEDCGSYLFGYIKDCAAPLPNNDDVCQKPRCQCLSGYVRVEDGSCKLPETCCSVGNTTVVNCPAQCDATCSGEPYSGCQKFCRLRKCVCKPRHVRDATGNCILEEDCCASTGPTSPPESSITPTPHPTPPPSPFPNSTQSPPPYQDSDSPSDLILNTPIGSPDPHQFTTLASSPTPTPNGPSNQITSPPPSSSSNPTSNPPSSSPSSSPSSPPSSPHSNPHLYPTTNTPSNRPSRPPLTKTTNPPANPYPYDEYIQSYEMGCDGDPNAVSKPCGDPCPLSCDNMQDREPQQCPSVCMVNGCACKPGFVVNDYGKCIYPEDCD